MSSVCPKCKHQNKDGAKFCGECGRALPQDGPLVEKAEVADDEKRPLSESQTLDERSKKQKCVKIGMFFVPLYAVIIVALITTIGVAVAALLLYRNYAGSTTTPQQTSGQTAPTAQPGETQVEEGAEAETTVESEESAEAASPTEFSYETASVTVSVPFDPVTNDGERFDVTYTYPVVTANAKSEAVDKINAAIKETIDAEAAESGSLSASSDEWRTTATCTDRELTVSYMDDSIVCIRDYREATNWGAHGWYTVTGIAYDLKTGKVVDGASLFNLEGSALRDAIVSAVEKYAQDSSHGVSVSDVDFDSIKSNCLLYPTGRCLDGSSRYYVSKEGLVYTTEDYAMGSFATGKRSIVVAAWNDDSLVGTAAELTSTKDE